MFEDFFNGSAGWHQSCCSRVLYFTVFDGDIGPMAANTAGCSGWNRLASGRVALWRLVQSAMFRLLEISALCSFYGIVVCGELVITLGTEPFGQMGTRNPASSGSCKVKGKNSKKDATEGRSKRPVIGWKT